jgi:CheY-like chemotaxis protein
VDTQQRTLLFIEDDPDHQLLVRMSLSQHDHYGVLYASDGAEGVAMARSERPDIILLDIMMPKMDGLDVLDRLQSDPATRSIPVVILSAKALPEDVQAGLSRGARAYLTKPFDALHLEERLDDVLGAASGS